jgi:acyl-[acyl-carrier-protein]-phospholipid O-acyltransferase / long-chain-fatty-acid--[acyl-carrier-protein] ligase
MPIAVRIVQIVNDKAMMGSTVAERALYFISLKIARLVYRVRTLSVENLPAGGFLLLPNHISFVDAVVLQLACPRRIRFIIDQGFYRNPILHPILRIAGCIPITPRRAKDAMRTAAEKIRAGEVVCVFPEGQLSRSGTLLRLRRGYELIAREADAPVVPVWLDRLWGSIFSFQGGRYFSKWPKQFPYGVEVDFGQPLGPDQSDIATVREKLLELGERAYNERPVLRGHLGAESLRGLKRHPFRTAVVDGADGTTLSRGKLLGAAITLARHLRKTYPEKRIGIVLPPGKGGVVANLAVTLADKVPVNLNFTSARQSIESAIEQAEVRTLISASALAKRLPEFPWTPQRVQLDEALPKMKATILGWWILALLLPATFLARILKLPRAGDRTEAILLFTSGSSGKPKGVVLSHRNILGNVTQFAAMLDARKDDLILATLPFFHSFGCTVTVWYPMVEGVRILTFPTPLETETIADLVEKHKATLILAAPTFLRGYVRKVAPQQLKSVRLVITGAEKLPLDLAEAFEKRFGKHVFEGYGLTETSPVVSVNLPEPRPSKPGESVQPSSRVGSTGKMAPGIAAHIRDPETDRKLSLHESGMLWLRGPNIFQGYLNDPDRTAEVLHEGWFKSGDLGRFDEDGFLFIEGRLSRFSKIGGEMVPHEAVEKRINDSLGLSSDADRMVALVGIPDAAKGEALVLLSAIDIDLQKLRASLSEAGLPNLWIPKSVRRIDAIPVLASGKLNLAQCKLLAEQSS